MRLYVKKCKAESTPLAELSGADDVNKTREGRETQKKNSPRTETRLLGLRRCLRLVYDRYCYLRRIKEVFVKFLKVMQIYNFKNVFPSPGNENKQLNHYNIH